MKPVIQLARKPDGLPVVLIIDGPEGPPVTADELAELLRVAYLRLGKSTVDKAIAATSYEDALTRFAKPDPVRAYLAEACGWQPGKVPADSVLLDSAEQLFCADRGVVLGTPPELGLNDRVRADYEARLAGTRPLDAPPAE